MQNFRWVSSLWRNLLRRAQVEEQLDEEVRSYLALLAEERVRKGVAPDMARREAMLELGGVEQVKEEVRGVRAGAQIETLAQDLRYGLRMLAKNPGFTAVAVLTLALGIGVNSTIFSVISTMLLRKPPVQDPDRLMMLCSRNEAAGAGSMESHDPVSPPDFIDWRAQATSFSAIAAASSFEDQDKATLGGGSEPERVPSARVSTNYFEVLGVSPLLGRAFLPGEDQAGHDRVALLRADLWRRRFSADPGVLGRTVKVNGDAYTVVGVMPDSFRRLWMFPEQLWVPLAFTPGQLAPAGRRDRNLSVFGRLKSGASEAQARSELKTIAQRIAAANPETDKSWGADVLKLQDYAIQESNAGPALAFLMAAVGFVLLIACANLANLLLARNANRRREFSVRAALGASRFRLARQLLCECLLLGLLGGGLGLVFAVLGLSLLRGAFNWNEWSVLIAEQLSIDRNVLLFTLAISAATALIFGLAPAFQISRRDPGAGLKEDSRSATAGRERHRLQNLLVAGELALSLVLLVGASLFAESFVEEMRAKPGMDPRNVLTASVSLSGAAYKDPERQAVFFQSVLRQLSSLPEVKSAAATTDLPFAFPGHVHVAVEGRPAPKAENQERSAYFAVSTGYFTATRIPLHEGREFTPSDNASSLPVAIVNEAFVQEFFPREDPIGRHISLSHLDDTESASAPPARWSEIIGVAGNVDEYVGQQVPRAQVFEPFLQHPDGSMDLVVRLGSKDSTFAASLRRAVWDVDKDQPVAKIRTMDRVIHDSAQGDDIMTGLMSAFAGIALVMAAVGIYGLIAYLVGRRTHELGLRMALGARRREILLLVLRGSMRMVLAGVAAGFLVSLAMPRLIAASFQGFHVHSGGILAATPVFVLLLALASSYIPARRASRVDPMVALRHE
jgi:putative ABC transport system permease protein